MATKKRDPHPKASPVIVRWIDTIGSSGWGPRPESKCEITSVGHFLRRDKKTVLLALNRSHYGEGDFLEIPCSAVKSVRRLKE